MSHFLKGVMTKGNASILALSCLLVLSWMLYPSFRYEKASMGKTEIKFDRFTKVIYLRNSLNPNAEWMPTKNKDIMETKYHLAEKELEEAIEETGKKTRQRPMKSVKLNRIIILPDHP